MNILFQANSGLRFLVLLVGAVALLVLLSALGTGRAARATRGLTAAFVGLLDLQVLLGLALVLAGIWYGALMGHLVLMVVALVVAHVASIRARRSTDARRAIVMRLVAVAVPLALIVGGIMAIGRSVFGSAPPTPG